MESLEYLDPDFDPKSLKVAQLRNILHAHSVDWPSDAKKPQLVELFRAQIAPNAKRLRAARSRTKPSTRGIVDVPSSQTSVADEEEDLEDEVEQPPSRSVRSSRRSTRQLTEDAESTLLVPPSVSSRRTSARNTRSPEFEAAEAPSTVKRGRKSVTPAFSSEAASVSQRGRNSITPALSSAMGETPDPKTYDTTEDESPFTQDNPFQSGSSPPEARSQTSEQRRKTTGSVRRETTRKSSTGRRKTEAPIRQEDVTQPRGSSSIFEMPVTRLRKKKASSPVPEPEDIDSEEAGEEFTAEEAQELALGRIQEGTALVPHRRKQRGSSNSLKAPLLVIFLAVFGALSHVYNREKLQVGYCGVGYQSSSLAGWEVPEWAHVLLPRCEQCPQHAYCSPNLETRCEHGFVLKPHPLTAGGKLPLALPPTCEPDTEKAKKVKSVADRVVEELRERNAKFECSQLTEEDGKLAKTAAIAEESLKASVSAMKKRSMSQEDFEDLWKDALGEVLGRDEITSGVDGNGQRTLVSNSLARLPLSCAIRRSIRTALVRYLWSIVIAVLLAASAVYTRFAITSKQAMETKAKQLASYALDRLSTQATLHAHDPSTYPEAFISMAHLRDDVLRDEFSAARRLQLWERVQKKVEGNSNVRPMVREGRHGDKSRVWEWVGAVGALESGRSGGNRDSSRYSMGDLPPSSPSERLMPSKEEGNQGEMREVRKWEEGRAIY